MSTIRRRWPAGSDAGQIPTVFMTMVCLGLVMVIFWIGLPFGQATDLKSSNQSAADAAALGAAEQIKKDFPDDLAAALGGVRSKNDLTNLLDFMRGGYGLDDAGKYARLNDATVNQYTFNRFGGLGPGGNAQIRVEVQSDKTADLSTNGRAGNTAYAKLGLRLGSCSLRDDPEASPSPTPTPTPTDDDEDPGPPPPPPDTGTELRCGDLVLHFTIGGEDGHPRLDTSLDDLEDQFDTALTG